MSRYAWSAGRKRRATIATHKLYWVEELKFGSQPDRGGVLVLNGVGAMSQLPEIEQATPKNLAAIDFNPGHRYADFNPKFRQNRRIWIASARHRHGCSCCGETRILQSIVGSDPRSQEVYHGRRDRDCGLSSEAV